ncbi:MAG: histidine phosphotransferase [Prochlorococcaceae cyanobacterium ETNP7_MAG_30]|nr:histidine phosphotransferase [Prochlorococcaceae cyanobacterium ETNP7_MAG_30]
MPFNTTPQRTTRRRSSAGPVPPKRQLSTDYDRNGPHRQGPRPTFLALRDHGKVYVADLPNLSDGQLAHIAKEAEDVLESLDRRISDLEHEAHNNIGDSDTFIKASTKRDVTRRFIRAIQGEQEHRLSNPALRKAAAESLPRTFLEVSRHRLPGATFDSLLQEALAACEQDAEASEPNTSVAPESPVKVIPIRSTTKSLPVVVTPDPNLPTSTSNA